MSLHIVMTGYDKTVFQSESETCKRFCLFLEKLKENSPDAELSYIAIGASPETLPIRLGDLTLIPAHSLLAAVKEIISLNSSRKISVLTTQSIFQDAWAAYLAGYICHCPVVVQEHNDSFDEARLERNKLKKIFKQARQYIALKLLPLAAGIRAVNPETAELLSKRSGFKNMHRVKVIPVPITLVTHTSEKRIEQPCLLYVGRLDPQKNVEAVLAVSRIVRKHIPDLMTVIVGDGSLRQKLETEAPENTVFTGWLGPTELQTAYQNASVLLVPSWYEGFGRVLLEAMAAGVPVVSSTAAGPKFIIKQDGAGLMAEAHDIEMLASHVLSILHSPETRNHFQQQGYVTVQRFSPSALAEQWMGFLREIAIDPD